MQESALNFGIIHVLLWSGIGGPQLRPQEASCKDLFRLRHAVTNARATESLDYAVASSTPSRSGLFSDVSLGLE